MQIKNIKTGNLVNLIFSFFSNNKAKIYFKKILINFKKILNYFKKKKKIIEYYTLYTRIQYTVYIIYIVIFIYLNK